MHAEYALHLYVRLGLSVAALAVVSAESAASAECAPALAGGLAESAAALAETLPAMAEMAVEVPENDMTRDTYILSCDGMKEKDHPRFSAGSK